MRMFHREHDGAKVARNRGAIFDLHAHALDFMGGIPGFHMPSANSISSPAVVPV